MSVVGDCCATVLSLRLSGVGGLRAQPVHDRRDPLGRRGEVGDDEVVRHADDLEGEAHDGAGAVLAGGAVHDGGALARGDGVQRGHDGVGAASRGSRGSAPTRTARGCGGARRRARPRQRPRGARRSPRAGPARRRGCPTRWCPRGRACGGGGVTPSTVSGAGPRPPWRPRRGCAGRRCRSRRRSSTSTSTELGREVLQVVGAQQSVGEHRVAAVGHHPPEVAHVDDAVEVDPVGAVHPCNPIRLGKASCAGPAGVRYLDVKRNVETRSVPVTATTNPPLTRRGIPVDRDLRILALGSFANRFGAGAVLTTSALYFTRQVGFSATEVALAMSVSAVVGIVVQVPAGHLGDTRGPRRCSPASWSAPPLFSAPPVLARTPWMLALLLGVLAFFERGAGAVNQGVIAQLATGGRGVLFKAYLRAVTNTALGLGSVFGGAALIIDERWAYVTVFFLNAVFTGLAAWNTTRLPDLAAARAGRRRAAPRGPPRLAVRRHHDHHGALLPALLRHGARPGPLRLRAHVGAHRHGRRPAHHQHGRRRPLPGAAVAPGRLGRGRRAGRSCAGRGGSRLASPSSPSPTAAACGSRSPRSSSGRSCTSSAR